MLLKHVKFCLSRPCVMRKMPFRVDSFDIVFISCAYKFMICSRLYTDTDCSSITFPLYNDSDCSIPNGHTVPIAHPYNDECMVNTGTQYNGTFMAYVKGGCNFDTSLQKVGFNFSSIVYRYDK